MNALHTANGNAPKAPRYAWVFFDLDGTLTDPGEGITNSVAYALEHYGITVEDRRTLYPFIGPPLHESFSVFYGFSPERALEAVEKYREYYGAKGIFENRVYPGIPALLQKLRAQGYRLAVASSKPTVFVVRILEHFSLSGYFDAVVGAELDGTRTDKGEVVREALSVCQADPARVLMIGDRKHDLIGARKNGVAAGGVLYGFGSREELEKESPAVLFASAEEIASFL